MTKVLNEQIEQLKSQSEEISNIVRNFLDQQPSMLSLSIDPLKYLSKLPEFSGDYRDLQNFIDLIDKVHPLLVKYDDLAQSIFSDHIKSKLKGRAREVIEINAHVTSWSEIKTTLVNNFGDRLTIEELFDELRSLRFKTNSIDFYNDIKTTLRRLNVKTKQTVENDEVLSAVESNKTSALTIFKNKLPEPMRSILHCRNPDSLETGINILYECGYAYFNPPQTRVPNNSQHNTNYKPMNKNRVRYNDREQTSDPNRSHFNQHRRSPTSHRYNFSRPPHVGNQTTQRNFIPHQTFPIRESSNNNQPSNVNNPNPQRQFNSNRYNNSNNQYSNYNRNNARYNNLNTTNQHPHRSNNNYNSNNNGNARNNTFDRPEPMEVDLVCDENKPNPTYSENFPFQASDTDYPI